MFRGVQPRYSVQTEVPLIVPEEEQEEENEVLPMDTREDEVVDKYCPDAPVAAQIDELPAPISVLKFNGTSAAFPKELVPKTLLKLAPQQMAALSAVDEFQILHRQTLSAQLCLPMPVESSPIVMLFLNNPDLTKEDTWKHRYISWTISAFQLRQLVHMCMEGLLPLHHTMSQEKRDKRYVKYASQLKLLELNQFDKIVATHVAAKIDPKAQLLVFISACEEYGKMYIHMMEHFLFDIVIAPHGGANLAHCLTNFARPITLEECFSPKVVRDEVVMFFWLKCLGKSELKAGKNFYQTLQNTIEITEFENDMFIDLKQLPYRIEVQQFGIVHHCPAGTVYNGYITLQTIYEYWQFCDVANNLGDDWYWDLRNWK